MKKTLHSRLATVLLGTSCLIAALGSGRVLAATPGASAQEEQALRKEFREIQQMAAEIHFQAANLDAATLRLRAGPQVIALLTPKFDQMTQFAAKSPQAEAMARIDLLDLTAQLAYWGQKQAIASIDQMGASDDRATAIRGQIAQNFLAWRVAEDDKTKMGSALETIRSLAAEAPTDNDIARAAVYLVNHRTMPVSDAHSLNLVVDEMKTPSATAYSKLAGRIGEPVVITGTPLKGSEFSTAKWKGKVVMVDFWATWCPPCRASIPEVIERYKKYHDQGFEILGISSDSVKRDLTSFLAQNPDMVWPQLFTANSTGSWHPLTKKFDVQGVPTVFLIDRNGILREQESGRPLKEEMIVKVLAETDEPSKVPAAAPVPAPAVPIPAAAPVPGPATKPTGGGEL